MRIAVIGAGRVGTTLGGRWATLGHEVVYGVRDPTDARHAELGSAAVPAEAVHGADVAVLALPWGAVESVLRGMDVGDTIVIDATNPLGASGPELSGAELVSRWTGSRRVVKAFNTTGWENMADPAFSEGMPVMFVAGDDEDAKRVAQSLASEVGFDAIDAGPLSASADLEHLAALWIRLAHPLGHGRDIAFSVLRRRESDRA